MPTVWDVWKLRTSADRSAWYDLILRHKHKIRLSYCHVCFFKSYKKNLNMLIRETMHSEMLRVLAEFFFFFLNWTDRKLYIINRKVVCHLHSSKCAVMKLKRTATFFYCYQACLQVTSRNWWFSVLHDIKWATFQIKIIQIFWRSSCRV